MWETYDLGNEDMLWAAIAFNGGIGGQQQAPCGAVSASVVCLGLRHRCPLTETQKAKGVLQALIEHYAHGVDRLPDSYREIARRDGQAQAACDYIAGMTDQFALDLYRELFLPKSWGYS